MVQVDLAVLIENASSTTVQGALTVERRNCMSYLCWFGTFVLTIIKLYMSQGVSIHKRCTLNQNGINQTLIPSCQRDTSGS